MLFRQLNRSLLGTITLFCPLCGFWESLRGNSAALLIVLLLKFNIDLWTKFGWFVVLTIAFVILWGKPVLFVYHFTIFLKS